MNTNSNKQARFKITYTSLGLATGLILGGIIGLIIGNLVIFAGGGMVIGLALGAALDKRRAENSPLS